MRCWRTALQRLGCLIAPLPMPREEELRVGIEGGGECVWSAGIVRVVKGLVFGRVHGELGRY